MNYCINLLSDNIESRIVENLDTSNTVFITIKLHNALIYESYHVMQGEN